MNYENQIATVESSSNGYSRGEITLTALSEISYSQRLTCERRRQPLPRPLFASTADRKHSKVNALQEKALDSIFQKRYVNRLSFERNSIVDLLFVLAGSRWEFPEGPTQ